MIIKILSTVVVAIAISGCKPPTPPDATREDMHRPEVEFESHLVWLGNIADEIREKVTASEKKLAQLIDQDASELDLEIARSWVKVHREALADLEKKIEEVRKGVGVEGNIDCISETNCVFKTSYESIERSINTIEQAVNIYSLQHNGVLPVGLNELTRRTKGRTYTLLKKEEIVDRWGKEFEYKTDGKTFSVRSSGPDKKMGTKDDITN